MSQVIELIVSPTGETKLESRGFAGESCRDATRFLEQALGQRSTETLSAEFYLSPSANQAVQQGLS